MTIVKQIRVSGAVYGMVETPKYDARLSRYSVLVRHTDGREQIAYSRFPDGPFVFTLPAPENNQ